MEYLNDFLQNNNYASYIILVIFAFCLMVILCLIKQLINRTLTITDSEGKKKRLTQYKTSYKNNQLKSTYYLSEGHKDFKETFYYKSGELNKEQNWNNGLLEGVSKTFYKSGELYILANYKNGKLDDDYTVYSKSGKVIERYTYSNGELING